MLEPQIQCIAGYKLTKQRFCTDSSVSKPLSKVDAEAEKEIAELITDPEKAKLKKILELELEVMQGNCDKIPSRLRPRDWLELLKSTNQRQRRSYLLYMWRNEMKTRSIKERKALRRQKELEKGRMESDGDDLAYGLRRNTLFLRIRIQTMNMFYHHKLFQAMLHEPTIIYDLDYEQYMTRIELFNCVKQLVLSFAVNRTHDNPVNLYFCNANSSARLMQLVQRSIPTIYDNDFPLNVTSQSYLDIFDKKSLVYLTPNSHHTLTEYDPSKVYIIGALVDKANPRPLSLAKAKKEGIQTAKLPLDKYLKWTGGSGKNLALNQVLSILLDQRIQNNWEESLQHVPRRKLRDMSEGQNAYPTMMYTSDTNINEFQMELDQFQIHNRTRTNMFGEQNSRNVRRKKQTE